MTNSMFSRVFGGILCFLLGLLVTVSFVPGAVDAGSEEEALAELLQNLNAEGLEPPAEEAEAGTGSGTGEATGHDAAELLDGGEEDRSLAGPENISVEQVGSNYAVIKTTEVLYQDEPVSEYKIYYSNSSLETQDFDKINDMVVEVWEPESEENMQMQEENMVLLRVDQLDADMTYYVVVTPVHPTDPTIEPLTMISNEVSFTTEQSADANTNVSADTKIYEQVGYKYNQENNEVRLTWSPNELAQTTEVNLRHQSEGSYQTVGKTETSDGEFTFTVSKSGNYFLKMRGLDENGNLVGKEHIQTIRVDQVEKPQQPVQSPPEVGPTSDIIIGLLILSAVFYMVYRFRRIES